MGFQGASTRQTANIRFLSMCLFTTVRIMFRWSMVRLQPVTAMMPNWP